MAEAAINAGFDIRFQFVDRFDCKTQTEDRKDRADASGMKAHLSLESYRCSVCFTLPFSCFNILPRLVLKATDAAPRLRASANVAINMVGVVKDRA